MQTGHVCLRLCLPMALSIGNTALRRTLKWGEHRYWYARDSLLEEGKIARARGRGGAVRRVLPEEGAAAETAAEAELIGEATLAYVHEAELYLPIRNTLETFWAKERQIEPLAVERQPRLRAGGVLAAGGRGRILSALR